MQQGFTRLVIIIIIGIVLLFGFRIVSEHFLGINPIKFEGFSKKEGLLSKNAVKPGLPVEAGKQLSANHCQGEGVPYKLSVSPMRVEDFSHIEPYGLMIGDHVSPIDHQYFSPTIFRSPKDTYPVFAMADSKLVNIEPHPTRIRLIFSVTCNFFYYYDLLTSLEPNLTQKNLPIDVKAGQLIGHIGGQTLDFAVWDTKKPLSGFIVPEHYRAEPWKIYTADPLDYYTDDLKSSILSKYVRTAEPVSGKIDYDIDGKLIGNWFEEGKDGYAGESTDPNAEYWKDHLSIAPFAYDPSAFIISVGFLTNQSGGDGDQFSIPRNAPSPATVGVENGLIKYELRKWEDVKMDGSRWDHLSMATNIRLKNDNFPAEGCALAQLLEKRKLKFEVFLKQSCDSVNGFSKEPKTYQR